MIVVVVMGWLLVTAKDCMTFVVVVVVLVVVLVVVVVVLVVCEKNPLPL